ncbi:MAG: hypothetical protein K2M64_00590, partial [Clostridia bacterium]|nr:hypothetical protein [Clostridia bacterium]
LGCIEKTEIEGQRKAGQTVSYSATTLPGFARRSTLGEGKTSTDQNVFVLGDGSTVIITYYERQSYTMTWNFNGGYYYYDKVNNPSSTATVSNRYSLRFMYGEEIVSFKTTEEYLYISGYVFNGWFTDSACTISTTEPKNMPSNNVVLYAGRRAEHYSLTFFYDTGDLANTLGVPFLPSYVLSTLNPLNEQDNGPASYTIEQIINNGVIQLGKPTMTGFKFMGWVYYDDENHKTDDTKHSISSITKSTVRNYNLHATWQALTSTVSLDSNGGNRVSPSTVKLTNLTTIPNGQDGAPNLLDPDAAGYISATRSGYTFVGWQYRMQTGSNIGQLVDLGDEEYDVMRMGVTLYAKWEANPVRIDFAEGVDTDTFGIEIYSSYYDDSNTSFEPWETVDNDYLIVGSILTIHITPNPGYQVNSIEISGVSFTNHGRYTVRTYADDTIIINVKVDKKRYTLNYALNGGEYRGSVAAPSVFVIEDTVNLYGGSNIYRLGYDFVGWSFEPNGEIICNAKNDWTEVSTSFDNGFAPYNTTLYANWEAAPVTLVYHSDYIVVDSNGQQLRGDIEREVLSDDIKTGENIELWIPDTGDKSFVPDNRELIGWALISGGDIAYNVNYKYNPDSETKFDVTAPHYTVRGTTFNTEKERYENHLYAVWRVTNVQTLNFEAENNNQPYSPAATNKGVQLTARPRYAYEQEGNLELTFNWYKIEDNWDVWTYDKPEFDGLDKDSDEYNQYESYVLMKLHYIPSDAVPVRVSPTLTDIGADGQLDTFGTNGELKDVIKSGLYICALNAKGTYLSANSSAKISKITMYGEYYVNIEQADIKDLTLKTPASAYTYNGQPQGLTIGTPAVTGNTWAYDRTIGAYVLPDGSYLKVNYTYYDENNKEINGSVINVGEYRVVASFEMVDKNGAPIAADKLKTLNYKVPDKLNASMEIAAFEIKNVQYVIQTLDSVTGEWTTLSSYENMYTGQPYRIVAMPQGVFANDDVSIAIFYDGVMDDHEQSPVNVGNYIAYCNLLEGEQASNYNLTFSDSRPFSIIKADHQMEVTFKDYTTTYNNTLVDMTADGRLQIFDKISGKYVDIVKGATTDRITLADGCTITLVYDVDYNPFDALFDRSNTAKCGGTNAGVYNITISFVDDAQNAENYNEYKDVTATLTINQADYGALSDEQLNRYIDGDKTKPNPNGFGDPHSVTYDPSKYYNPKLNLDTAIFEVTYSYEIWTTDANGFSHFEKYEGWGTNGINGQNSGGVNGGLWRVTAQVKFNDAKHAYSNNYLAVDDYTVELRIMPAAIIGLEVLFNQTRYEQNVLGSGKHITYGDTIDFNEQDYYAGGDGSTFVKIKVKYEGYVEGQEGNYEYIDTYRAEFFAQDYNAFVMFDKATVNLGGQKLEDSDSEYYLVRVNAVGETADLEVKVYQKQLAYDNIGFDSEDPSVQLSGSTWRYSLTYDGQYHYPALDNDNGAYNFVGIPTDTLEAGKDIVATYKYNGEAMPANGYRDAATYNNLTVEFTSKNSNYAIDASKTRLTCNMTISAKVLQAEDIIWQYTNELGEKGNVGYGDDLAYCGTKGYTIHAVYLNLAAPANAPDSVKYLNVGSITLRDATEAREDLSKVNVTNVGAYYITIDAIDTTSNNYKLPSKPIIAELDIVPCEVEIEWLVDGKADGELRYSAQEQLEKVTASYKVPEGYGDAQGTISIALQNADTYFIDAGTYAVVATISDKNFVPANGVNYVEILPYIVSAGKNDVKWIHGDNEDVGSSYRIGYTGEDEHVYVTFSVLEGDNGDGVTNGYRTVPAYTADGELPHNVGSYTLSAGIQGNYDLTNVTLSFGIRQATLSVNWATPEEGYVYNGEEQSLTVTVDGLVGADKGKAVTEVLALTDTANRNAGNYVATAQLAEGYAVNYAINNSNTEGIVTYNWSIQKLDVQVKWNTEGLVYNNGYALTDWSYEIVNAKADDVVVLDYSIEFEGKTVSAMVYAGEYVINVEGVNDSNYSVRKVISKDVKVDKATPVISNVAYNEYDKVNTTYDYNETLRNDRISYVSSHNDVAVSGTIAFKSGYSLAVDLGKTSVTRVFPIVFTPDDEDNYYTVESSQLRIEVIRDSVVRLGFNNDKLITFYAVSTVFDKTTVEVYFEYASYYEETVGNKTVAYGQREKLDNSKVTFEYNNRLISTYQFKEEDADDFNEQPIYVYAMNGTRSITGEIDITVTNSFPTDLKILNKSELEDPTQHKFYVGMRFDKFLGEYEVAFENGLVRTVSPANITCSLTTLPESVGDCKLTFTFFTNTEHEVEDSIIINVSAKEVVRPTFTALTLRYTGNTLELPPVLQQNGEALPSDVRYNYLITDMSGRPTTLADEGEYRVRISFIYEDWKYDTIEDINVVVSVKKITAELIKADEPQLNRFYNGNVVTDYKLSNITIANSIDHNLTYDKFTAIYTINGQPAEEYTMLNAGTYEISVIFKVVARLDLSSTEETEFTLEPYTYTITISPVENKISTFVVNNWIYGEMVGRITVECTFDQDKVVYEYYRMLGNGTRGDYVGTELSAISGPGYYIAVATLPQSANYATSTMETTFVVTKGMLTPVKDVNDKSLVDNEGKSAIVVTANGGVNPNYDLRVEMLDNTDPEGYLQSVVKIKSQIVLDGYEIKIVDADGNVVEKPGEYTVKILLTAEQLANKNIKVYSVDKFGAYTAIDSQIDDNGYLTFKTSNFNGNFVVGARDAAAAAQMAWIIAVCVGGFVAICAIVILIVVVIKKKKEND